MGRYWKVADGILLLIFLHIGWTTDTSTLLPYLYQNFYHTTISTSTSPPQLIPCPHTPSPLPRPLTPILSLPLSSNTPLNSLPRAPTSCARYNKTYILKLYPSISQHPTPDRGDLEVGICIRKKTYLRGKYINLWNHFLLGKVGC